MTRFPVLGMVSCLALLLPSSARADLPLGAGSLVLAIQPESSLDFRFVDLEPLLCGTPTSDLPGKTWLSTRPAPSWGGDDPVIGPPTPLEPQLASIIIRPRLMDPSLPPPPPLGSGVILELDSAQWSEDGTRGQATIRPRRVCAVSTDEIAVSCAGWHLSVALQTSELPWATLELVRAPATDGLSGGSFHGVLSLPLQLRFENVADGAAVSLDRTVTLRLEGPWNDSAGSSAFRADNAFAIDTNCDGETDAVAPRTSDLFLGWRWSADGEPMPDGSCGAGEAGSAWLCVHPALW